MAINKISDIDLSFNMNPFDNDIMIKRDHMAVAASLINLFLNDDYAVPYKDDANAGLERSVFKTMPRNARTLVIRDRLITIAKKYEPECEIVDVIVDSDSINKALLARFTFKMKDFSEVYSQSFRLSD